MNKMANFIFLTIAHTSFFSLLVDLYLLQKITRGLFLVGGCFLRQVLGVCSIRVFAKNIGDPYYEPSIVVHDSTLNALSPEGWGWTITEEKTYDTCLEYYTCGF